MNLSQFLTFVDINSQSTSHLVVNIVCHECDGTGIDKMKRQEVAYSYSSTIDAFLCKKCKGQKYLTGGIELDGLQIAIEQWIISEIKEGTSEFSETVRNLLIESVVNS